MSGTETIPLSEETLSDLSAFLGDALPEPEHRFIFQPEVLRWKFLDPIGSRPGAAPRSFVVREDGRIVAHIGLHYSDFDGVPAVYPYDWVTKGAKSPQGLMLLLRMHRLAEIHYILGCTDVAAEVYKRSGYQVVTIAPHFQKVLHPAAWGELHRRQPFWKKVILLTLDRSQSLFRPGRKPRSPVELRAVREFGAEVTDLAGRAPRALGSRRHADWLNHCLRFPLGTMRGWSIHGEGQQIGFALANLFPNRPVRLAKILDCCVATTDLDRWHAAIYALVQELRRLGCQQVAAYGTAPWTAAALRANGFFERGHTPLYWRDTKHRVPLDRPFHLTYLEADTGLL